LLRIDEEVFSACGLRTNVLWLPVDEEEEKAEHLFGFLVLGKIAKKYAHAMRSKNLLSECLEIKNGSLRPTASQATRVFMPGPLSHPKMNRKGI